MLPEIDKRKLFRTAKLNSYFVSILAHRIKYINNKPVWFFLINTGIRQEYITEAELTDFCL